jgi:hypothetical protein
MHHLLENISLLNRFWIGINHIACKPITDELISDRVHSRSFWKGQGHSEHAPSEYPPKECYFNKISKVQWDLSRDPSRSFGNVKFNQNIYYDYYYIIQAVFEQMIIICHRNKMIGRCLSDKAIQSHYVRAKVTHSKYTLYVKQTFNDHCTCHS